ncbi:unnamed protein product [Rhodiola kirilowii]
MSGGARVSSGITSGVKKTIQDIREIAGQHSDEDIHAMLKECSMDPNETIQRLIHLDTFHEVKKKHGRRKENVESRAFNHPGKQNSAWAGRGASVGRGNFHPQNASLNNGRKTLGGSKENGYIKMSEGHNTENKTALQSSRSGHVKFNGSRNISSGKNSQGWAPQAHENISSSGNQVTASPGVQPSSSIASEGDIDVELSHSNSPHGEQYAVPNGNITLSKNEIQSVTVPAKSQLTDCNSNRQSQQTNCAAKDVEPKETGTTVEEKYMSEVDVSAVLEEASKLNISDSHHVVFPDHLQVPEAYKKKLTFGSFDSIWTLDGKQTSGCEVINSDALVNDSCPASDATIAKTSTESGVIFSTTKDAQETEDPNHLQSLPPVQASTPHTEHALSDVVIKLDEPESESLLCKGGSELANSANNGFGYAPHAQLQAHESAEPQGGNFIAPSASSIGPNSIIHPPPPGVSPDLVSSPPPAPVLKQTYHPNFFPYGHYYPQFFVPQGQQYMTHGGLPQQPSVANVYLTSAAAAAAGIKYPHQQHKQGSNGVTDGYIGVPSGYSPYIPYAFPYGLPPVVIPGNVVGDDDHANQAKESSTTRTTQQQIESSGEWMAGTGRPVAGMQLNQFYSLGQGHPMGFPTAPAGFGPFGGVYHPSAQTIPAPQPTVHPQIHQPQSMGPGEPASGVMSTSGFYQQQSQVEVVDGRSEQTDKRQV